MHVCVYVAYRSNITVLVIMALVTVRLNYANSVTI